MSLIYPHKTGGLWLLPLKTAHSAQTLLTVSLQGPLSPSERPLGSYLEYSLQRLHVATFALHNGAQDVPPDHLLGPEGSEYLHQPPRRVSTSCTQSPE